MKLYLSKSKFFFKLQNFRNYDSGKISAMNLVNESFQTPIFRKDRNKRTQGEVKRK